MFRQGISFCLISLLFFPLDISSADLDQRIYSYLIKKDYTKSIQTIDSVYDSNKEFLLCHLSFVHLDIGNEEEYEYIFDSNDVPDFFFEEIVSNIITGYNFLYRKVNRHLALEYFYNAKRIANIENYRNLEKLAILGILDYLRFEHYSVNTKERKYLNEYLSLSTGYGDTIVYNYFNVYFSLIKTDSSSWINLQDVSMLEKSATKVDKQSNLNLVINSLLAICWEHQNNISKAVEIHQYVLNQNVRYNHLKYINFRSCLRLASLFSETKPNLALDYIEKSKIYMDQNDSLSSTFHYHAFKSDLYASMNEMEKAYFSLKKARQAEVALNVQKSLIDNANLESKLRTAQSEKRLLNEEFQNEKLRNDLTTETIRKKQLVITSISLGTLLSLSLIGFLGLRRINKLKQENLRKKIIDTQQKAEISAINAKLDGEEQERKRVASALHDGIASHLSAANIHLSMTESDDGSNSLMKAKVLIEEAAERSRSLSHELYPPILLKSSLIDAIESLTQKYATKDLNISFTSNSSKIAISDKVKGKAYFVVNEALMNVMKHSYATDCEVSIIITENELKASIIDNGVGISTGITSSGLGMSSMASRIHIEGGEFEATARVPNGTIIKFSIPL